MNWEFIVRDVHKQLGSIYYVRFRSGLLLQKFIIKYHQLRMRDMFTTFYFISKVMLTKPKASLRKVGLLSE
jgi:hypothetical protein